MKTASMLRLDKMSTDEATARIEALAKALEDTQSSSRAFAESLIRQYHRRGNLSEKQWPYVEKLTREFTQPPLIETEPGPYLRILEMLEHATAHKKFPAITLETEPHAMDYMCPVCMDHLPLLRRGANESIESLMARAPNLPCPTGDDGMMKAIPVGHVVKFARAGNRSRNPGRINITDGLPFGDNTWYGYIDLRGHWFIPNNVRALAEFQMVHDLVDKFAADPETVAAQHGKVTHQCCFCNQELTDDRSKEAGYGPVCARHYGLDWGK